MKPHPIAVVPGGQAELAVPDPMTAQGGSACSVCPALPTCMAGAMGMLGCTAPELIIGGRRKVGRHQSLYRPNDVLATLFQVRSGQFKLVALDLMGEQRVIGFYMAGDLLGLDGLATGQHQLRAVALEDSEVCEISYAGLQAAMSASPAALRQFIQLLGHVSLREAATSAFMSNMRCEQRLGYFLLNMSSRHAALGYSGTSFMLRMSRADIGSYVGITPESVSRLIGRFKHNGWITVQRRNVGIADREQLQRLLSADPIPAAHSSVP